MEKFYSLICLISSSWPLFLILLCFYSDKIRDVAFLIFFHVALSISLNSYLKEFFRIPLHSSLNNSAYAFPSGHILINSILYISLAIYIRKPWFYAIVVTLLIAIIKATEFFNYHDLPEMIAGLAIGLNFVLSITFAQKSLLTKKYFLVYCGLISLILQIAFAVPLKQDMHTHLLQSIGCTVLITIIAFCLHYFKISFGVTALIQKKVAYDNRALQ